MIMHQSPRFRANFVHQCRDESRLCHPWDKVLDMAIRLAKAFGATPDIWIRMQAAYDLAQARLDEHEIKVKPYRPQHAA